MPEHVCKWLRQFGEAQYYSALFGSKSNAYAGQTRRARIRAAGLENLPPAPIMVGTGAKP